MEPEGCVDSAASADMCEQLAAPARPRAGKPVLAERGVADTVLPATGGKGHPGPAWPEDTLAAEERRGPGWACR